MARAENAAPYYTLDEYRRRHQIPICAFNGVNNPDESLQGCDRVWAQWEREVLAQALDDAERQLATYLGYYIGAKFLTDYDHEWRDPIVLNWGHIVGGGVEAQTDVTSDVSASDFTTDPATITIPVASFGGVDEVQIVETSSGLEIFPDSIVVSGTDYIISIDQCKLIGWDDLETQTADTAITYDNTFPATEWLKLADLTIYRHYLDTTSQADIEFGPSCECSWCGTSCAGTSYTGCVYVIDREISKVRVQMAEYSATGWACNYPALYGCYKGDKTSVYYQAGTDDIPNWRQAVARLAHTLLDFPPCGCAYFDFVLRRDRSVPSALTTAERINCPLGQADGAWYAWQWVESHKHGRAFML